MRTQDGSRWRRIAGVSVAAHPPAGRLPIACDWHFSGITFLDRETGFVSDGCVGGERAYFYVTHDGGVRWFPVQPLTVGPRGWQGAGLDKPRFFSPRQGVIEGTDNGTARFPMFVHDLWATGDRGFRWKRRPLPVGTVTDVDFVDPLHAFALVARSQQCGATGLGCTRIHSVALQATSDGGHAWRRVGRSSAASSAPHSTSSTAGTALPTGPRRALLLTTTNGGRTWRRMTPRQT